jgi:hypothetical protein
MRSFNILLLLFLAAFNNLSAQEPAWWTKQKKDCGLDPKLTYEKYQSQGGSPCPNKDKPAVVAQTNDPLIVLSKQEEEEKKAKEEAEKKAREEAEAKKKKEEEEKREKDKQDAIKRLNGSSNQSFGLTVSPDFDGLKNGQTNTYGLNSSSTTPSNDPMVVDARNVPSGLAKDVERSIDHVYKDSPLGVSARVKKAFQSVQVKDWVVAKVWFQEALKLDPNDKKLQTFIELCDYVKKDPKKTPASKSNPKAKTALQIQKENEQYEQDLAEWVDYVYYNGPVPKYMTKKVTKPK